jgi:hypothetical protein
MEALVLSRDIPPPGGPPDPSVTITFGRRIMSHLRDLNVRACWAGITGFVWYAFGTVPLQIAVSGQLGLTTDQSSSWMFIVWFTGAIASITLSLSYRQPLPITWTIPGLVYLGTLAGQYTCGRNGRRQPCCRRTHHRARIDGGGRASWPGCRCRS